MHKQDILIELGTEELPPKALPRLSAAFMANIQDQLNSAQLSYQAIEPFATPRRLALLITALDQQQPDQTITKTGPAIKAAFAEDGTPSKAAEGFARSCGVAVSELSEKQDGKVMKLAFETTNKGLESAQLLPGFIQQALEKLPVPKRMRWGSSRIEFVRPVHWLVLLQGDKLIDATIMGVKSGNITYGHRFMSEGSLEISKPAAYKELMRKAFVIADFSERKDIIRKQILAEGEALHATAIIDEDLLNEVTALVEWPVALTGTFDQEFLNVPKEALISSMKEHQKCFHLLDDSGKILPNFITISNLASKDPGKVISGNEKVIRPRLADAAFFFNQDKKFPLSYRCEKLKTVVFQKALGTLADKSSRVSKLAVFIAEQVGSDTSYAQRAAELGKCDLMTSMVYEFAELQGIMGYYYALHDGEAEEVAQALNEQYMPRFAGDNLPETATGIALALAERLDTIVGLFGIGQPPTGSKDPFALRRAALGVLRIIIEKQLTLNLDEAIVKAVSNYQALPESANLATVVMDFIYDRLKAWYSDQSISSDIFQSVAAVQPASPLEFDKRIKAVNAFVALPQSASLAAANKRVSNILAKSDQSSLPDFNPDLAIDGEEKLLAKELSALQILVKPLLDEGDFNAALSKMASLQTTVDDFFDHVMVNVDDQTLRNNRLALLQQLRDLFMRIADISCIQHA